MLSETKLRRKLLLVLEKYQPNNHVQLLTGGYSECQIEAARSFLRAGRSVKALQARLDNLVLRDLDRDPTDTDFRPRLAAHRAVERAQKRAGHALNVLLYFTRSTTLACQIVIFVERYDAQVRREARAYREAHQE